MYKRKQQYTQDDAIELGIPLALLNAWQDVMDVMWVYLLAYARAEKTVTVTNKKNGIYIKFKDGSTYKITVNFVNQKYLKLYLHNENDSEFECTISHINNFGTRGIVETISILLTYADRMDDF